MYKTDIATHDELRNWNKIVSRCPYSEALHTVEWRNALTACFKQFKPLYYIIRDGSDCMMGAFPCLVFRPTPFGGMLLSMPWSLPGGPLIFPEASILEATLSVIQKLGELSGGTGRLKRRPYFETTITLAPHCDSQVRNYLTSAGYLREAPSFTHLLDAQKKYGAIWKGYKQNVQTALRKATRMGVMVRESEEESDMRNFYKLYLAAMDRFNSTPKPYQLLRHLQTSPIARLVVADLGDKIIAGQVFLHFNSTVRLWCLASDPDFLNCRPNNMLLDYVFQWACEHGYPWVDFGASPPGRTGIVAFKEAWGSKKAGLYTFTKVHVPWKKKLWAMAEPSARRVYSGLQRFRARSR